MTDFARVVELLKKARDDWAVANNRPPRLRVHGATFGWDTHAKLLAAKAFGLPLIAPETMAPGEGRKSNLVVALRTGVDGFARMPRGGPYLSDSEIDEIADWISDGAKLDAPPPSPSDVVVADKPAESDDA